MNLRLIATIWWQPLLARKNLYPTKWLTLVYLTLLFVPALISIALKQDPGWSVPVIVFLTSLALCLGVIILYWFISFLPYSAYQYTSANAKLLPTLRQHLRLSLFIPLILLPALIASCFYRAGWHYVGSVAVTGFIAATLYSAGMRDKRYFYVLGLAMLVPGFFSTVLQQHSTMATPLSLALWLLTLPAAWYFTGWIYPQSGEAIYQARQNLLHYKQAIESAGTSAQVQIKRNFDPYFKRLDHLLAQGQQASKASLLGLAFGNTSYALTVIFNTLMYGIPVFTLIFWRDAQFTNDKPNMSMQIGLLVYCIVMLQTFYFTLIKAVSTRRYELSLLLLTPQLNNWQMQRAWNQYLLGQFLQVWIINLAIWLVVVNFLPVSKLFVDYTLIMQVAGLIFVPGLLRNYRNLNKVGMVTSFQYLFQLLLASALLCGLRYYTAEFPLFAYVGVIISLIAALTYWKWLRYQTIPAFPAACN